MKLIKELCLHSIWALSLVFALKLGAEPLRISVETGHSNNIKQLAFSPDGKMIVSGSSDTTIRLWDVATGHETRIMRGHGSTVHSVVFSPDGRSIVSGGGDNTVRIWDVETGHELLVFKGHTDEVTRVVFSPDGRSVASAGSDRTLRIWDTVTGKPVQILSTGHKDSVTDIAYSPDGKFIVTSSYDKTLKLWNLLSGEEVLTFTGHRDSVNSILFLPDGKRLVSGSSDTTIKIWNVSTGEIIESWHVDNENVGNEGILHIATTHNGKTLASSSRNGIIRLWDTDNGTATGLYRLRGIGWSVAFSPDDQIIAAADGEAILLWKMGEPVRETRLSSGHTERVSAVAFSPDGELVVSASPDDTVKLWEVSSGQERRTWSTFELGAYSVAFSPDGTLVAAGIMGRIMVWELASGKYKLSANIPRGPLSRSVNSIAFSPDGRTIASGDSTHAVRLWDIATSVELRLLGLHKDEVGAVAFSKDGSTIASGSDDGQIKLWDAKTGRLVRTFAAHKERVNSLTFSPNGKNLLSGSLDKTIKLWNVGTGRMLRILKGQASVYSAAFSPDGKTAIIGSHHTLRVWDIGKGTEIRVLNDRGTEFDSVAFSPDGRMLVSGSQDGSVKLWDARSGEALRMTSGHRAAVKAVAAPQDSLIFASGSSDKTIVLWDLKSRTAIRTLVHGSDEWSEVEAIAISKDGKLLASVSQKREFSIWEVGTGRRLHKFPGHEGRVKAVDFSPDGKLIASASNDSTVKLWDVAKGRLVRTIVTNEQAKHPVALSVVAFSPDGSSIAAGGQDEILRLWSVETGAKILNLSNQDKWIKTIAFSPDGKTLVANGGWLLKRWDITTGQLASTFEADGQVRSAVYSPDGKILAAASEGRADVDEKGIVNFWNVESGLKFGSLTTQCAQINSIAYAANGKSIVLGCNDGSVSTVATDLESSRLIKKLPEYRNDVQVLSVSEEVGRIATGNGDGLIRLWDLHKGAGLDKLQLNFDNQSQSHTLEALAFSPTGNLLIAGGRGDRAKIMKLWETASGQEIFRAQPDRSGFNNKNPFLFFSHDESRLLSGMYSIPEILDAASGKFLLELGKGEENKTTSRDVRDVRDVIAASYSPDGKSIFSIDSDGTTEGWNAKIGSRSENASRKINKEWVEVATFSNDGRSVAFGGSSNSSLKIRYLADGREITLATGQEDRIRAIAFSRDNKILVSSIWDSISIWDVDHARLLKTLPTPGYMAMSIFLTADSERVISLDNDGLVRWRRVSDGETLVSFVDQGERGWVTITPEGYFNASSLEAAESVNIIQGMTARSILQFWEVFFRPDLVQRKLAGEDIASVTGGVTLETVMRLPPPKDIRIHVVGTEPEKRERVTLHFEIEDAGGGIGEVRIFHNGKLTASEGSVNALAKGEESQGIANANAHLRLCRPVSGQKACEGEIAVELVPGEENEITLIAFNAENTIQSLPAKVSVMNRLARRSPQLWILAVGIDKFSPSQSTFNSLVNAGKDARDFVSRFPEKARSLFKREQIHVLGAEEGKSEALLDKAATREAILALLDEIARKAKPEDTFVWFVASHGTTDNTGAFGIVPHDVICEGKQCSTKRNLISAGDILEKSTAIKAMNQLIILDTCQSGALDAKISGLYDARMAALASNMGLHLYASAQPTEQAYDGEKDSNGLFTSQLLAGMGDPRADENSDGLVTIKELGDFSRKQTMKLSAIGQQARESRLVKFAEEPTRQQLYQQIPLMMHFGRDAGLFRK